ncbi:MAG: hypothetical protein CFE21_04935 [Bacteroidetes bacterium B1(2017)]|nr:MAG: hypothetical protein CFE21_04935 [Bacteroidetes bacterium B1(2017)]
MKKLVSLFVLLSLGFLGSAQTVKVLFDASKAETAGNADWVIDEDLNNMTWNPNATIGSGSEGNAQRYPTPAQSGITASTLETYWKGALSAWGVACAKQGYGVETLPYNGVISYGNTSNPQDLSNYSIYVICEPNILFTAAQKTAIIQFVQNGGGLFLVADHANSDRNNDGKDSPQILNDLFKNNGIQFNPFGFLFDSVSVSPLSSNIPNLPNDSLLHGPMGDVTQVMWASGNTISLDPSANATIKGIVYNNGSAFGNSNVLVAYCRYGKGKVVAIGDSSPADDGTGDTGDNLYNGWTTDANGNHGRLIMNGTIWLATKDSVGTPPPPLIDLSMDSILAPISLQRGLNQVRIKLKNLSNRPIDSLQVFYSLNQSTKDSANLSGLNIAPGNSYTYTFSNSISILTGGNYTLKTWVKTPFDPFTTNDTLRKDFSIEYKKSIHIDSILEPITLQKGSNSLSASLTNTGEVSLQEIAITYALLGKTKIQESFSGLDLLPNTNSILSAASTLQIDSAGSYTLCVFASKLNQDSIGFSSDTLCKNYVVTSTGLSKEFGSLFTIFPNPLVGSNLIIDVKQERLIRIELSELSGKTIHQLSGNFESPYLLELPTLSAGVYLLKISTPKGEFYARLLK